MFDFGGWELILVAAVAVFVIGPKELPATLRTLGRVLGRLRALSASFRVQVDEMIRESELDELRKTADAARTADFGGIVEDTIDPDHAMRDSLNEMSTTLPDDALSVVEEPSAPEPPPPAQPLRKKAPTRAKRVTKAKGDTPS